MFPVFSFGQIDVPIQNISTDSNVRYRLFATKNIYNFIKLDTRNGLMWQVQWSTKGRNYRFETVLNEKKFANSVEEIKELAIERYKADSAYWEEKKENWYKKKSDTTLTEEDFYYKTEEDLASWYKPKPLEESLKRALDYSPKARNGRFFLYPTDNIYNFILLDQIDGRAWQVQWNIEKSDRMVIRIY
jgi:hypothetical protein